MELQFLGAVRTVTGSMTSLYINGEHIVFDAGLYQGRRKEAFERNRRLPIEPAEIDRIVLSHAHIDHSGNLPTLVKQGFRGPVFCTPATADLLAVMLKDSAYIQTKDVAYVNKKRRKQGKRPFEPLYDFEDVGKCLELLEPVGYGKTFTVCQGAEGTFFDAGHILGSASLLLEVREDGKSYSLGFTGDLGRKNLPILRDPSPLPSVDWLVSESTYGNRLHPPPQNLPELLAALVEKTLARGGTVLIPAFSVGRTQNIVYTLHSLISSGRLPDIPIFVDSPLSSNATEVFRRHGECFDEETLELMEEGGDPFGMDRATYVREVEGSKALNTRREPCVIISASGMCEGGRILHHLKHRVIDERNLILIVGFQAEHTLGRRLVLRVPKVRILGDEYPLRAEVSVLNGYSAHADRDGLIENVETCAANAKGVFLLHGNEAQCMALQQHLEARIQSPVHVPHFQETFRINGAMG